MLSASTISSSSSAFSANGGGGLSTPSSQYSQADTRKPLGGGNPLTELIETEQSFMETLKMIDSQIAPIWMKQMTSAAPDFSELLKYIHDILKANKRFCMKLSKIETNPQAMSELGDILMQWVNDLEVPYANYCRSYIPNLNQRTDILRNPSIQTLLHNLSANVSYEINLESLFNAPIQQLKYYKGLYSRLLDGTDSGRADHKLLLNANKRIDMIMVMARNNNNNTSAMTTSNSTISRQANNQLNIQTNFQSTNSDLTTFERQVDCSRTVDLYGGAHINYQLRLSNNPDTQLIMRDGFIMMPENGGPSIRAHVVLTTEVLVICRELNSQQFLLLYPGIPIGDVTVKAESLDREIVGEYIIRFSVLGKKHIMMRVESKEIRNTWIGQVDPNEVITTAPRSLTSVAQKRILAGTNIFLNQESESTRTIQKKSSNKSIRNTDIFTYYHENGGVSPLESSDEEEEEEFKSHNPLFNQSPAQQQQQQQIGGSKPRDTIMDIYDGHLYDLEQDSDEFPLPPQQQTVNNKTNNNVTHGAIPMATPNKDRLNVSNNVPSIPLSPPKELPSASQPVKDSSHVQMTFIQPPTAQMAVMSISTPTLNNSPLPTSLSSSSSSFSSSNNKQAQQQQLPVPPVPISTINYNNQQPVGSQMKNNMMNDKPSSPRAVEVQRAVIPEAMQAVTQKTDEYIQQQVIVPSIPRTSSMRHGPPGNNNAQGPPLPSTTNKVLSPRLQSQPSYQQQGYSQQQRPPMMQQQRPPSSPGLQQQQAYGYNRPMPSPPPQQQQFRPMNNMNNNSARPIMSPQLSPSLSNNTRRGPPPPSNHQQYGVQQPPGRFNAPSPAIQHLQPNNLHGASAEDLMSSPPHSPNPYNPGNDIRQILYSSSQCDVFHWNNNSWYAADGQCLLQVRVTHMNRACVAIQLQNTGQLYLNAWILPNTVIRQPSATDVSISVYMGVKKENYLVHFQHSQDANVFSDILRKVHAESAQQEQQQMQIQQPEPEEHEPVDTINVPQTLKPVMQCKAKLFIKNETSSWSTFGGVSMRISQQAPSMRMMIQIENDKTKLVSAIVKSGNVEKISSKRISFLLVDEVQKTSIVYMVHLKEDQTGNKIYEYLRTKNAENGW